MNKTLPRLHAVFVLTVVVLSGEATAGPRHTFPGPLVEVALRGVPSALTCLYTTPSRPPEIAIALTSPPALQILRMRRNDSLESLHYVRLNADYRSIAPLRVQRKKPLVFAGLRREVDEVGIITLHGNDAMEHVVPVEGKPDGMITADVDDDGSDEVLLYGKSMAGLAVLKSGPAGTPAWGESLFPEIVIAGIAAGDFNADGVLDLVFLDWLKNRLDISYGLGGGRYTEPVSFDLPGEPGSVSVFAGEKQVFIAVTLPSDGKVVVYQGDFVGSFKPIGMLEGLTDLTHVVMKDINDDRIPDVVCHIPGALVVGVGDNRRPYAQRVAYHVPLGPLSWYVADCDNDGSQDLLFLDAAAQLLRVVCHPRTDPRAARRDQKYLLGPGPGHIVLCDPDRDGRRDVLVTNTGGATLSVLQDDKGGTWETQPSIIVPDQPDDIFLVETRPAPSLITLHPATEMCAIVPLHSHGETEKPVTIPLGPHPSILFAGIDPAGRISLIGGSREEGGENTSVTMFEQTNDRLFNEHTLRPLFPSGVQAGVTATFTGQMKTDFVVSSHEQHDFQLLLLPETSQTHWGSPRLIGVLDDSLGAVEWLAAGDVDRDGNTDLLVGIGPPFGGMGVFFSPGLPTAPEAHVWISEFLPRDERSLHIADVDRDGKVDMIAVCGKKREIQFLRGKGNREFERPADIAGGAGCTSFALHPTAGSMDLLVVRGEQGTLSVLKNRFRRP